MSKSPKNRRQRRTRSRSPQVDAGSPQANTGNGTRRSPNNPMQRTLIDTASTFTNSVQRVLDSGAKIISRRNKSKATSPTSQVASPTNQAKSPKEQQDDAFAEMAMQQDPDATSMTVNTPSINTPDGSNSGNNTEQGYGAMDVLREASFISGFGELASQTSQASQIPQNYDDGTNAGFEFSPIGNQVASPSGSDVASGVDLVTPPRQNSPRDSTTVTGMDLLDTPNTTANDVAGTLIPAPSPRRSTQSPETHRLQQALRNNATEQVLGYDYAGSTSSNEGGNTPSAFSTFGANYRPIAVETVNENSDDGDEWLDEGRLAGNTVGNNVQINSVPSVSKSGDSAKKVQVDVIQRDGGWFPTPSETSDEAGIAYDSSMAMGVASTSPHAGKNLVISTVDPGQADFAITVGNLGNASGTPLDGSHNQSFGEDATGEERIVDSAAKSAASRTHWSNRLGNRSSVKADDETESNASIRTPPNYDQSNPEVIGDLLS